MLVLLRESLTKKVGASAGIAVGLAAIISLSTPATAAAQSSARSKTSGPEFATTPTTSGPIIRPAGGKVAIPEDFDPLEKVIKKHFATIEGRKEYDLLSKRDVEPLFAKLQAAGWKVSRRENVLRDVLPDNDEMLQALRTSAGTKFMRQIADYPRAYDRLDHLRRMPYGMRRVHELIRGPDGYKMIQYMTTTRYGRNLGQQLSQGVNGGGFNESTGRLYTQGHVLVRLKAEHAFDRSEQIKHRRK